MAGTLLSTVRDWWMRFSAARRNRTGHWRRLRRRPERIPASPTPAPPTEDNRPAAAAPSPVRSSDASPQASGPLSDAPAAPLDPKTALLPERHDTEQSLIEVLGVDVLPCAPKPLAIDPRIRERTLESLSHLRQIPAL